MVAFIRAQHDLRDESKLLDDPYAHRLLTEAEIVAFVAAITEGERWLGTAIGTDGLDVHAARLGVRPTTVSSATVTTEGVRSTFRLLGDPLSNAPPLPFFIEWDRGTDPWPREEAALNPGFTGLKRVEAAGDAVAVAEHLGGGFDFISVVEGVPEIKVVILDAEGGEIRIE